MNPPRERRQSDVDPVTGKPISPLSNLQRIAALEKKVRRDRVENRVMYVVAVAMAVLGVFLYGVVQEERRERRAVQAQTDKAICDRQEVITQRLIDTKKKIEVTDTVLRELVLISIVPRPDSPPPSEARRAMVKAFRERARVLATQIAQLQEGERILRAELEAVDCENLDAGRVNDPNG